MRSKFVLLTLTLISSITFLIPDRVSAQPSPNPVSVVIANINLSNAAILSQDGNTFRIAVDFVNNGETSQSDIKYGVELVKKRGKTQTRVDTFISDEILTIDAKETLHKELTYTASPLLSSGDYELWLLSRTTGGLILGIARVGEVSLASTTGGQVMISPESCYLQVKGDTEKYTLLQGVDVEKEETLSIHCSAKNNLSHSITVSPSFETHERSVYGPVVGVTYPETPSITFKSGETKEFSFIIQKPERPQAYDASLILVDSGSRAIVSSSVTAHYVLRGASATIQNASLDKAIYEKGDLMTATLFWSPSADSFPTSRSETGTAIGDITLKVDIVDGSGTSCADTITRVVTDQETNTSLTANASITCVSPRATLTLTGKDGKVLDSRTFSSPAVSGNTPVREFPPYATAVLAILLGASMAFFMWKKYLSPGGITRALLLVAMVSSSFFVGAGEAQALTYGTGDVITTVNTNKSVYAPGETIVVSGMVSFSNCGNGYSDVTVLAGLTSQLLLLSTPGSYYLSGYFTAPSSPGAYTIDVSSFGLPDYGLFFDWSWGSIPITVSAPLGTVNVSSNISSSWTITGPEVITGSGTSQSYPSKPTGAYTIAWGAVSGYTAPASQSLSLGSGGTISFSGSYAASCSSTAVSNCTLPSISSGSSAGSCAAGYTGSCSYSCNNGVWSQSSNSCVALTCSNGANNYPTCNTCTAPLVWNGSSCIVCSNGGCDLTGRCINNANNPPSCSTCTPPGLEWNPSTHACVPPAQVSVSISANPSRVRSGASSTITWSGSGIASCSITRNGASWGTDVSAAGKVDSGITSQTVYAIASCKDNTGTPVNITNDPLPSATVNLVPGFDEF